MNDGVVESEREKNVKLMLIWLKRKRDHGLALCVKEIGRLIGPLKRLNVRESFIKSPLKSHLFIVLAVLVVEVTFER